MISVGTETESAVARMEIDTQAWILCPKVVILPKTLSTGRNLD